MDCRAAEVGREYERITDSPACNASGKRVQPDNERVIGMPDRGRSAHLDISQVIPTATAAAGLMLQRD